jgi:hypothetical protein
VNFQEKGHGDLKWIELAQNGLIAGFPDIHYEVLGSITA